MKNFASIGNQFTWESGIKPFLECFTSRAVALLQQLQSAESDLDAQTKLVLSLQESLDGARKGQDSEKEVN